MSAAPPTDEQLQAGAAGLKPSEGAPGTKAPVDAAVVATYKKAFADNSGDSDKVCAALGLDKAKWSDSVTDEKSFLTKFLGVTE